MIALGRDGLNNRTSSLVRVATIMSCVMCSSLAATLPAAGTETKPPPGERYNLLLVVADDMGFTDLGSYGAEIETPHLDALAYAGLRLSHFHTAPTCAPTRAMLLSGTDNHLAGLGSQEGLVTDNQEGRQGYEMYLTDRVDSFVARLRDSGYQTFMSGKWHLGSTPETSPGARGFERWFALLEGGGSHFSKSGISPRDPVVTYLENGEPVELPDDYYSSDYFTQRLIRFLSEEREAGRPFFAYLSFTAPHWPLHARVEDMALYEGKYDAGFGELRRQRIARAKAMGLLPDGAAVADTVESVKAWGALSVDERRIEARKMEVYAAMIHRLDWNVGQLVSCLEASGERDDTVIVFLSDNGAEGHLMEAYPSFVPWIAENFDNRLANIGHPESFTSLGPGWAHASNGLFRLYKGYLTEGGGRVPAIVVYPGAPNSGAISNAYATVMDIAPTFLDLAGLRVHGRRMRGKSMSNLLLGRSGFVHGPGESISWELFGRRAVHRDRWKLLWLDTPHGPGDWQLYDIEADPGETNDLSGRHPQLREALAEEWSRYAESVGVILPSAPIKY